MKSDGDGAGGVDAVEADLELFGDMTIDEVAELIEQFPQAPLAKRARELFSLKSLRSPGGFKFGPPVPGIYARVPLDTRDAFTGVSRAPALEASHPVGADDSAFFPQFEEGRRLRKDGEFCIAMYSLSETLRHTGKHLELIAAHYGKTTRHISNCAKRGRELKADESSKRPTKTTSQATWSSPLKKVK